MSTTTISERITLTRHPDGAITVNAYAPAPLHADDPSDERTYQSEVFHGYYGNGFALPMWRDASGGYVDLPAAEVDADKAEEFLRALAELALRANGGAA